MNKEWAHKSYILKTEQLTSLYRPDCEPQTQNPSTQGIYSNYSAFYTYKMYHLWFKLEETLKKAYSLSSMVFPISDWNHTLAADPNLPKLNAYSFLHPDS